jgi:hypothetical protein
MHLARHLVAAPAHLRPQRRLGSRWHSKVRRLFLNPEGMLKAKCRLSWLPFQLPPCLVANGSGITRRPTWSTLSRRMAGDDLVPFPRRHRSCDAGIWPAREDYPPAVRSSKGTGLIQRSNRSARCQVKKQLPTPTIQ